MKNILLLTDFSENSFNAINYALRYFKKQECHFYVLNIQKQSEYIMDDLIMASSGETVYDCIATDNKKELSKLVKTLKDSYPKERYYFHPLFDFDNLVNAVNQAVQFHEIELIVMGTNGATGAKEVLFGSNTVKVIRNAICPVLAIPEGYQFSALKTAIFYTEKSEVINTDQLNTMKDLLTIHKPEIHVVEFKTKAVKTEKEKITSNELFAEFSCHFHSIDEPSSWSTIRTTTQLLEADFKAIFVHKESLLERIFSGSKTSSLTYETRVPLLLLPTRE